MKTLMYICLAMLAISLGCSSKKLPAPVQEIQTPVENHKEEVLYSFGNMEILSEIVDSAKDKFDVDVVRLWSRDTVTNKKEILLQTVRDKEVNAWYLPDGKKFIPIPFDSVPIASFVSVLNDNPLQMIVGGCPDMRNIHCFFIDVPSRKAWFIPANAGFLGETEEGFLIFNSYRYVSNPELGGRYTFIQIFNMEGELVDSLSLEHHHTF